MSASLPEWKQQLLERKRREEEEKERREHEEEARLANMPAWKRGIIQRRRAKQDGGGGGERERERGREEGPIEGELPPPQIATAMESRVAAETIRPVQQNPFIRSQSGWRGRGGPEAGGASGEGAGPHNRGRGQGGEAGPERETGETPEKEREKKEGREKGKKEGRERGNGREADAPAYPRPPRPLGPALRTIRAKNIIIIQKDRDGGREGEEEREAEGVEEEEEEGEEGGPKPPFRSKSSDCFVPPPRGEGRGPGAGPCRGVPKRSVSFSERPIDQEQGEGVGPEPQSRHSDSPVGGAWPDAERETRRALPPQGHRDPPTGGVEERERGRGSPSCVPKMEPEIQQSAKPGVPYPQGHRDPHGGVEERERGREPQLCAQAQGRALQGVPKRSVSFSERPIDQEQGEGVGPEPQSRHSDSPVGGAWPDAERETRACPTPRGTETPTGEWRSGREGGGAPAVCPKWSPKSSESYSGRLERSSSRQRGRETLCTAAIAGSPGTRRRTVRRLHGTSVASCRGGQRAEPVGQGAEPESEGVAVATLQTSLELLHLREAGAGGRKWPPQLGQKAGGETQPPPQALRGPRALPAPSSQPQTPKPLTISPRTGPAEQGAPADPTPADTPPLFSLRSSGGAQGKRGNTITISPRRSPAGLGAVRAGAPTRTGCSITVTPRATAAPAPTPTPNGTAAEPGDGGKKRYPTAQEIQVIGGYQSLDRSCLAKQRRKHKEVKVCFDDTRLEQLCEYPSESAWLACFPCPTQPITEREGQARGVEDEEEEEEEEGGAFPSGNVRMARPAAGRMLRVDESCHR
ncbi:hypothetical protein COCON_G00125840 [Conger conger]|uniref:Phostensin n=1 Tax=Conger conger TaxID=82655 RepID=A0A9Q1DCV6_CONCO|nr:hypothetical protein COCON_G00125840 [Conger conger]